MGENNNNNTEKKETEDDVNWFQKNYDVKTDEKFALHYDKDFDSRKYELLEVSDAIYEQLMDAESNPDGTIEFKGEPDEEAVLCTRDKTFVVKRVDTSNTLLLCAPPGALDDGTIERDERGRKIAKTHAQVSSHLDLTEIAPRLEKLKILLEKKFMITKSSVEEEEDATMLDSSTSKSSSSSYGFDFLLSKVQASETELRDALENPSSLINAVAVGENRWRGIDEEAIEYVLGIVMASAVESGKYDFSKSEDLRITAPEAYEFTEKKFPMEVLDFVLKKFGFSNSSDAASLAGKKRGREEEGAEGEKEGAREGVKTTKKDLVVRFKLERYIKHRFEQNAKFNYTEAINAVNEEIAIDEYKIDINENDENACAALFAGLAFFASENEYKRKIASALVANAMPREPKERFMVLWQAKPKWLLSELEPYLEGMVKTPGMTREATLLKYCRVSTNRKAGGGDLYSKR